MTTMENKIFQNKEMLPARCSCGEFAYIFVDDIKNPYVTTCKKCGKKIYQLTCKKCGNGFAFPQDVKPLHLSENWWQCKSCNTKNDFNVNKCKTVESFQKTEIPVEILARYKTLWNYSWFKLIMLSLLILAIYLALSVK